MAGRLMAASRLAALAATEFCPARPESLLAARLAVTAALHFPVSAALAARAARVAMVAMVALRLAATAEMSIRGRTEEMAALAEVLLAVTAALAATAATADRLMAAARLVAMAATELRSMLVTTSTFWTYGIAGQR